MESGFEEVMKAAGIEPDSLLGQGGEARVYALENDRVARVHHDGTSREQVAARNALLTELRRSTGCIPFAIPEVLDTHEIKRTYVTIERRLPGRPLMQVLAEAEGRTRTILIRAYLDAAAQIGDIVVARPWYGDVLKTNPVRSGAYQDYLRERATQNLAAAGPAFKHIDPARLAAALPSPQAGTLVHLDAYPGNMLSDGQAITAVLDFGASCIVGDRRLDPLTAAVYLSPLITPPVTQDDQTTAQDWLAAHGLAGFFRPAQDWLAAYWSFASNDANLHRWCRAILLDD